MFWGFVLFFVCYSEKSFPENSQSGSTLSSAQHLSPLASECQSGIKKPNRGGFERCHRGSKWLPAVCAWARPSRRARNCAVTQTRCVYGLPEPRGGCTCKEASLGVGNLGRPNSPALGWAVSKAAHCLGAFLLRRGLFVTSSPLVGCKNRWGKPPARKVECCKMWQYYYCCWSWHHPWEILSSLPCLFIFFNISKFTFFSRYEK